MINQEETIVLIDHLPEVFEERRLGYLKASEKIRDPYLKALFLAHSNFCEVLKKQIPSIPESNIFDSTKGHTVKWKLWSEVKTALKSGSRSDLLEACIKGEQRTIDLYHVCICDPLIPPTVKQILAKQLVEIKKSCDLLKIFKISL